jgi:hypothetical protein
VSDKDYWSVKVLVGRPAAGSVPKKHWHRVGSAQCRAESDIIEVTIDVVPHNWDGACVLFPVDDFEETP